MLLFYGYIPLINSDLARHFVGGSTIAKELEHLWIDINGRIDNTEELKKRFLFLKNHSRNDQIVLLLYQHLGFKLLDFLKGAFAFVISDSKNKTIFAARDQLGLEPFHYHLNREFFSYASQKKFLLELDWVDKSPNWSCIIHKIHQREIESDATEYLNIKMLPPAHKLLIENGKLTVSKYFSLDSSKKIQFSNDQDYIDQFRELFNQAVERRISKAEVAGAHLSGGVDSSGIAAFASKILKQSNKVLHTFSYTFPESFGESFKGISNENQLVHDLIDFCDLKHAHLLSIPYHRSFRKRIEMDASVFDGLPRTSNLDVEYEILLRAQKNNVDVVLSGFPGDELVSSFVRPYYLEYLSKGQLIKYFKSKHRGKYSLGRLLPPLVVKVLDVIPGLNIREKASRVYYNKYGSQKFGPIDDHLFNIEFAQSKPEVNDSLKGRYVPRVHQKVPLSLKEYQANHITRNHTSLRIESERLAANHFGLDYAYPMLDIDLVEYMLALPVEQKIDAQMTRKIYRKSLEGYVPDSIRLRDDKSGSLKPMVSYKKQRKDRTDIELWEEGKSNFDLSFLNIDYIESEIKYKRRAPHFHKYLLIVELMLKGKIKP